MQLACNTWSAWMTSPLFSALFTNMLQWSTTWIITMLLSYRNWTVKCLKWVQAQGNWKFTGPASKNHKETTRHFYLRTAYRPVAFNPRLAMRKYAARSRFFEIHSF
jgi:hypothetical protein